MSCRKNLQAWQGTQPRMQIFSGNEVLTQNGACAENFWVFLALIDIGIGK